MALFDQLVLDDQVPKVIDLGHQPFERFFAVMQQIDFADEARRRARRADGAVRRRSRRAGAPGLRHAVRPLSGAAAGAGVQRKRAADRRAIATTSRRRGAAGTPIVHPGADAGGALGGRPAEFFVRLVCAETNDNTSELSNGSAASSSRSAKSRCGCCSATSHRNCNIRPKSATSSAGAEAMSRWMLNCILTPHRRSADADLHRHSRSARAALLPRILPKLITPICRFRASTGSNTTSIG